ncbi:Eco57I restriction-modification methylase domain-containing protein [Hymenobacter sp. BRD67]|uniref:Eco57I restriction-modification methylase domain-containing protein n=1 Tax=Hymenobacter sp. BRD67 TaxID=2675877 RepID=UPI00156637FF|nr:hypothetical protein [Hymenobacter sp. BRD67]QKG54887.1 hypothetical protein GKZ67_20890 [Hymenobacter sp. BRD67]
MNPPFGAAAAASKSYLERTYPSAKMDIFAMFVARALSRLRPGGFVGIISSRTGYLSRHSKPSASKCCCATICRWWPT